MAAAPFEFPIIRQRNNMSSRTLQYLRITDDSATPGVCILELNRPPVNAFNDDFWKELKRVVEEVSDDPAYRVIVLASTLDRYFTAGLDLQGAQDTLKGQDDLDAARKALLLHRHLHVRIGLHLGRMPVISDMQEFQAAISSLSLCRLPVIVALHGACMGLAIDIASACDVRIASSDAVFSIAEINVGLAADIGTLQRFPKVIGNDSKARELALTGRKFVAQEAKEIGFVSDVVQGGRKEVLDAALRMARTIAEKSPVAVMSTKHLMNHARDHSIKEGLEYTAAWNMSMLQSQDTTLAMQGVLAKRTPQFPPLGPGHSRAKL